MRSQWKLEVESDVIRKRNMAQFPTISKAEHVHEKTVLTCSLCGETAVEFTLVDNTVHVSSNMRSYESEYLRPEDIEEIQREDLKRLNLLLLNGDGLDYYCPECDDVYCADHWKTQILFEDSEHGAWFDCIEGTCPKGHTTILRD